MMNQRGKGAMEAEVAVVEPLGSHLLLTLMLDGQQLKATARADFSVRSRDRGWLRVNATDLRLVGPASKI